MQLARERMHIFRQTYELVLHSTKWLTNVLGCIGMIDQFCNIDPQYRQSLRPVVVHLASNSSTLFFLGIKKLGCKLPKIIVSAVKRRFLSS